MGLALLGDSLSAEQAAQWGIIWQLVDDSERLSPSSASPIARARPATRGRNQLPPQSGTRPSLLNAQWGMIWQLVDDSELADTSLQLARHLAAQPTFGLGRPPAAGTSYRRSPAPGRAC
jgi:enoyl-CoA hydratase/carnithine racemase